MGNRQWWLIVVKAFCQEQLFGGSNKQHATGNCAATSTANETKQEAGNSSNNHQIEGESPL
jgi:hypothetical protein